MRLRLTALAAAGLLAVYGISMSISLPPAQQFHYNVLLLCAAMLAMSFLESPLRIGWRLKGSRVRTGFTHPVPGVTHRFVHANGLSFHLAEAGAQGPVVLLLHGFPQHWYAWRHVMVDLAVDHRVYALDLRGAGQSDAPRRGYDSATLAGDVVAVLDALELPDVQLVGHEWGGWLGFMVALAAPERVSSLVAVNAPHPWLRHRNLLPHVWRFWYTALLEYPVLGAWVIRTRPGVLRWLLGRGRPGLCDADIDVFVDVAREPARARAAQQRHWRLVLDDIPHWAFGAYRHRHLTVPSVLLGGSHDFALSPRSLTGAGRSAGDLRVKILDGGHYLPEERPELVTAAMRELTERSSRARTIGHRAQPWASPRRS